MDKAYVHLFGSYAKGSLVIVEVIAPQRNSINNSTFCKQQSLFKSMNKWSKLQGLRQACGKYNYFLSNLSGKS